MQFGEIKQQILDGKIGYDGLGVCDLCGNNISGENEDTLYRLIIEDFDLFDSKVVCHKRMCKRCNEVVQAFIGSITR